MQSVKNTAKSVFRRIFTEQYDIKHRLLNVILLAGLAGITVACVVTTVSHQNVYAQITSFVCLAVFIITYLLANKLNRPQLAVVMASIMFNNILLPLLYVYSGGIESGMPQWYLLGLISPFLLMRGKKTIVLFIINSLEFIALVIYTYYHPEIIHRMASVHQVYVDVVCAMLASVLVIGSIFKYQTFIYEKQQKAITASIIGANQAIKAKRDFLSNVSHDIRTPMDAIIGFTEIAKKNMDNPEKLADSLSKISVASNHLMSLVNEVLDISKIENGKTQIEEELCSLHSIIDNICQIMQGEMEAKNLTVETDYSMLDDDVLSCDKIRLNQILLNILSNAVKYSYDGGKIYISIIQLSSDDETKIINEFHIRDEGRGMSPEFLERVFLPFERDKETAFSVAGTGLGLTIAKSHAEIMGGTIEVTSELGKGSEFTVILPLSIPSLTEIEEDQDFVHYDFKGRRILVVDDNDLNREILVDSLLDEGFIIEEAIDGSFAIEKLRDSEPGYYDLIIMDLQMPVMDGYETTKIIRKFTDKQIAEIPIIALTADAFAEEKSRAFNAGMNAYLVKPVDMASLLKVLMLFFRDNKRS